MLQKIIDYASDIEVATFLIRHIQNPCKEITTGQAIRDFYIREARAMLPNMESLHARELLKAEIRKYPAGI
jgi:hypothetical protein